MRVAILLLLAACELQPAPKKQPAPVIENTGSAAQPAPPPPPAPAPVDAGAVADAGPTPAEASAPCLAVGAHVADVFIASATDPAQKSVYEQEREKMIRATAEACTKQAWSDPAQTCYLASKTPAAIKACETKFPAPAVAPAAPPQIAPGNRPAEMLPKGQRIRPKFQGSGALR